MTRRISRRNFLRTGAVVAASTVLAGCEQSRRWVTLEPYVQPPEEQVDGVANWYASACRGCSAGCGIIVRVMNGRAVKIEGNPEHPLNRGKLCALGQAGLQLLYNPDRLASPMQTTKRGGPDFARVPWESAIGTLADKIKGAGGSVAILGSPAMSGHLYDLFSRLAKAIAAPAPVIFDLRSAWYGEAGLVAASKQLFGRSALPAYSLGEADVVFSFGADFLSTWLSPVRYGIEYGRFRSQGKGLRGYLAQFEPRMSTTGAKADQWVAVQPGSEAAVAQAIARLIADQKFGASDRQGRAATLAGSADANAIAQAAGVPIDLLTKLARVFAEARRPLAIPGNLAGPNEVAAVQALNLIAGGAGTLLDADAPVPDLLRVPASTYGDLQALIDKMRSGAVKVLLVYGSNPVYELPEGTGFLDALNKVDFVASFTPLMDEMARNSNLILSERTYLESWGYDAVAPNFGTPVITGQQPVVQPLNDARSAGDVLISVAKNVPAAAGSFPWNDEVAFLREVVGKLPAGAAGGSGADVLWARFLQHGGWWPAQAPAPAVPATTASAAVKVNPPQAPADAGQYPYNLYVYVPTLLGSGAGANLPWLQGSSDPMTTIAWQTWVEIHPVTAKKLGVEKGDIVKITTANGNLQAEVYVYPAIRQDTIAIPLGQGHTELGRYAQGRGANAMHLLAGQAGPDGSVPAWTVQRCQITRTGQTAKVATLEWTPGVEQGFFNKGFPGE